VRSQPYGTLSLARIVSGARTPRPRRAFNLSATRRSLCCSRQSRLRRQWAPASAFSLWQDTLGSAPQIRRHYRDHEDHWRAAIHRSTNAERMATFVARGFKDCRMHFVSPPSSTTHREYMLLAAMAEHQTEIQIETRLESGLETEVSLEPDYDSPNAEKKCVTNLGTQYADGVITFWSQGNSSGVFTLRRSDGHTVDFVVGGTSTWPKLPPKSRLECATVCHDVPLHSFSVAGSGFIIERSYRATVRNCRR